METKKPLKSKCKCEKDSETIKQYMIEDLVQLADKLKNTKRKIMEKQLVERKAVNPS